MLFDPAPNKKPTFKYHGQYPETQHEQPSELQDRISYTADFLKACGQLVIVMSDGRSFWVSASAGTTLLSADIQIIHVTPPTHKYSVSNTNPKRQKGKK